MLATAGAALPAERDRTPRSPVPPPGDLVERHACIGAISVRVHNVFDTSDPRENYQLYRFANRLHIQTREATVAGQLLFAAGDLYDPRVLAETERLLRTRIYLFDAWIRTTAYDPATNTVDVEVSVRDVWTLSPSLSFGRAGGVNGSSFGVQEENLLGTGAKVVLSHTRNVDRESNLANLSTESLLDTHQRAGVSYSDNSDGKVRAFYIERPFYALDTRSAWSVSANRTTQVDSRYDLGQIVDQFNARLNYAQVYYGWSGGFRDGWTRRIYAGMRYDEARFSSDPLTTQPALVLPADRRLQYPWLAYEAREDKYLKSRNLDQIGRTEDLNLGRSVYLEVGRASRAMGADRDAWLARFSAGAGWAPTERQEIVVSGVGSGRIEGGSVENGTVTTGARYYLRETSQALFYAAATATGTRRLDADQQVLLGGDTGLRGYPLRFQTGTMSALATVEQRFYTRWYPFRLVHVGGAVFADAGRTWGQGVVGQPPIGVLKDVGFGLRLGNSRSGFGNVLHADVSWALDAPPGVRRYQFTVQTQASY